MKTIDEKNKENILKIKNGDQKAIAELYDNNFSYVVNQLKIFTQSQDVTLLEDIVQEVFCKLMTNIDYYEITNVQFRSWLFNAAKNKFIDYKRKKKNNITDLIDFSENPFNEENSTANSNTKKLFNVSDNNPNVIDFLVHGELEKAVNKYLDSLEDLNKRRVFKKYIDGKKYKDIADETDTNIGTVKSIIFIEKKKIKNILLEQNIIQ
jgi:RNA polymerase sigma-70 factor (ECF subfamily)